MEVRAITWNVFHGRDFPPDPALLTRRSRLLRVRERNATHAQVNRNLSGQFIDLIAGAEWDVALLQEFPPRWADALADRAAADHHLVLTSRNSFASLRRLGARINPDLIGSNEGGSNLVLVRPENAGRISERRELAVCPGPRPERRVVGLTRTANGLCLANLHASAGPALRSRAEDELRLAAEWSVEFAAGSPLIFGGDLNVRPRESPIFAELEKCFGLAGATADDSLDHLLTKDLSVVERPARWPSAQREVKLAMDLLVRLSDHAPVEGRFKV